MIDYQEHLKSFWNSGFYRVCRVKANEALKPEYLLKCYKRIKKVYFAENGDTCEKRKPYQSNPVIWIYRFLSLQRQDAGSYYFAAFLNYPRLSIESESIFLSIKYMAFCNIRNCMLKRDMEFRPFYFVCKAIRL